MMYYKFLFLFAYTSENLNIKITDSSEDVISLTRYKNILIYAENLRTITTKLIELKS